MVATPVRSKPKVRRQTISGSVLTEVADLIDEAVDIAGETLSQFVAKASEDRARKLIKKAA